MRLGTKEPGMTSNLRQLLAAAVAVAALVACRQEPPPPPPPAAEAPKAAAVPKSYAEQHANDYATVRLTADLSAMSDAHKRMLALLVEAAQQMDGLFWKQWWGARDALLARVTDPATRRLVELNYGPWDRLNEDHPFVEGVGPRPPGARFYPEDMTKQEFEAAALPDKASLYTLVRRDAAGALVTVPYHVEYKAELERTAALLREAAKLSEHAEFGKYLEMRAQALLTDDFRASDMAWMDMKTNPIDVVIGPIETYDDALFGYKASYEGVVLVKDLAWSERLARFAKHLPELQQGLPVGDAYKKESPGTNADLNAYFALFYAGNANVGGKTIAINLPNDEAVQLAKGSRRLQLENVMRAKFDKILLPIANVLIAEDQLEHVTFDAFFEDVMFHEVAHGLGIKRTIDGKGTVREALKDYASSFEEGKADVLGLYMIKQLMAKGELDETKLMDNYVTFLAGMLRSVRFGAAEAHGQANMVRFNFFAEAGAFTRDEATGRYRVDFDKMGQAVDALSAKLLTIQGDGDYAAAKELTERLGVVRANLQGDLKRLADADIPIDVAFEQGPDVLGLPAPAAP
jgi:hypothetical protein